MVRSEGAGEEEGGHKRECAVEGEEKGEPEAGEMWGELMLMLRAFVGGTSDGECDGCELMFAEMERRREVMVRRRKAKAEGVVPAWLGRQSAERPKELDAQARHASLA